MRRAFSRFSRTSLPGFLVLLELDPAVGPEGDFLGEPFVDGGERLVDMGDAASGDFAEVLGDERGGGEGEGPLLLVGANPGGVEHVLQQRPVGGRQAARGRGAAPNRQRRRAIRGDADELQPLGEDRAVAGLDLVGEQEEQRGLVALVGRVDEDGALAEQVGVLLQKHVAHGEHERVAGMHQHGEGEARLVERLDGFLGEADALVALEDGLELAAVAAGDAGGRARGSTAGTWVISKRPGFARIHRAAERLERLQEERADEVGLEAAGLGLLHLFLHREEPLGAHRLLGEGVAVEERLEVVAVEGVVDLLA